MKLAKVRDCADVTNNIGIVCSGRSVRLRQTVSFQSQIYTSIMAQ
jgi:hypothetical protein